MPKSSTAALISESQYQRKKSQELCKQAAVLRSSAVEMRDVARDSVECARDLCAAVARAREHLRQ
jgi:hypothetical protein